MEEAKAFPLNLPQLRLLRRVTQMLTEFYELETGYEPYINSQIEEDGGTFQVSVRRFNSNDLVIQVTVQVLNAS